MKHTNNTHPKIGLTLLFCVAMIGVFISSSLPVQSQPTESTGGTADAITYLPLVQNRVDGSLGIPIFGLQMYGTTSDSSKYHSYLLESDASWLRVEISWATAEPTQESPPVYNWTSIDNGLAAARADMGGLNIVATINRAPSWAVVEEETGPVKPDNLEDFANFMGALVERYDGDGTDDAPGSPVVLYWEMYNEPDSNTDKSDPDFLPPVSWGDYGEEYAYMLEEIYPAVKAANPAAQVVFGGIAYDFLKSNGGKFVDSFLTDVLDEGGGDYFDVMNFHSYPAFYPRWTTNQGSGLLQKANAIRNVLVSYGLDKPMIVTETGWHDNNASGPIIPGSQQIQARYVVELFTQGMAADLDIVIWWLLYDIGGSYPYDAGLVTNADTPVEKLAFQVYQDVVGELSTTHFERTLSNTETGNSLMEVHQFNDNVLERTLYVAWLNRVDTTATSSLRIPASSANVKNSITGNEFMVSDGNDGVIDGHITVTVGADPLFIEVEK
ncbi:cellulase family glycosylhydrolase [Candidatus Leptofilum sp.]|uniref:cellulase family glycosylhydrolase n=1 Tax=Candidatus Leptofilum sp. TaxID=3241576 RepID=UPI003B5C24BE